MSDRNIVLFTIIGVLLSFAAAYISEYYPDQQTEQLNLRQVSGIIIDKYADDRYHFVIRTNNSCNVDINGLTKRLYDAFEINEKIAVIVDDNNTYRYAGVLI